MSGDGTLTSSNFRFDLETSDDEGIDHDEHLVEVMAHAPAMQNMREPKLTHHSRKGLSLPLQLRNVRPMGISSHTTDETEPVMMSPKLRPQLSGATNSPGEDASFVDVELTIACSELPRLTHTNACMPVFAVLWTTDPKRPKESWKEYGRTEVVQHGTAPQFERSFVLRLNQSGDSRSDIRCKVQLFHKLKARPSLSDQEDLGQQEFVPTELYNVPGRCEKHKLSQQGSLTVRLVPVVAAAQNMVVSIAVSGVDFRSHFDYDKDKGSLPDLFFLLLRESNDNFELAYRSAVQWQSGKPKWASFDISMRRLCAGIMDNQLRFEVYDWANDGDPTLLGSVSLSARELVSSSRAAGEGVKIALPEGGVPKPGMPLGSLLLTADLLDSEAGLRGRDAESRLWERPGERTRTLTDTLESLSTASMMMSSSDLAEQAMSSGVHRASSTTVYSTDVGDDARLEDARFLSRMMKDHSVQSSATREIVSEGLRAVASRTAFMEQYLAGRREHGARSSLGMAHDEPDGGNTRMVAARKERRRVSSRARRSKSLSLSASGSVSLPDISRDDPDGTRTRTRTRTSAGGAHHEQNMHSSSGRASMHQTPSMLSRPRRMRHSFCAAGSTLNNTHTNGLSLEGVHPEAIYNIGGRSTRPGPVRVRASRRLSQKYRRSKGKASRGQGPSKAKGGDPAKLFNILFPRKRFSEMHDVEDDMSRLLRDI